MVVDLLRVALVNSGRICFVNYWSLRKTDKLNHSQTQRLLKQYFDLLDETLEKNNLKHSPQQIYDCDETFSPLIDFTREKAVAYRKARMYMHKQWAHQSI